MLSIVVSLLIQEGIIDLFYARNRAIILAEFLKDYYLSCREQSSEGPGVHGMSIMI